jgi:hypothetical protein
MGRVLRDCCEEQASWCFRMGICLYGVTREEQAGRCFCTAGSGDPSLAKAPRQGKGGTPRSGVPGAQTGTQPCYLCCRPGRSKQHWNA